MTVGTLGKENIKPAGDNKVAAKGQHLSNDEEQRTSEKSKKAHYDKKKENRKLKRAKEAAVRELERKQQTELEQAAQQVRDEPKQKKTQSTSCLFDCSDDAPTDSLFELQLSRLHGTGLFATTSIPAGTRILCEAPFLHFPRNPKPKDVLDFFNKLSEVEQAQYLELQGELPKPHRPSEQFFKFTPRSPRQIFVQYLDNIYKANSRPTTARAGRAIYLTASRINHSCTPNLYISTAVINQITHLVAYTIRAIAPNEELTTAYTTALASSASTRAANLPFPCTCPTCNDAIPASRTSDQLRTRLAHLSSILASPNGISNSSSRAAAATEQITLLRQEGLLGLELAEAYKTLSKAMSDAGNRARALVAKKNEIAVLKNLFGEAHERVKAAEKELSRL